jgi:hypothetical protein
VPESFEEARCIIDIAYAEFDKRKAEKALADKRVTEAAHRMKFYSLQASKAVERMEIAQMELGRARWAVRKGGFPVHTLFESQSGTYSPSESLFLICKSSICPDHAQSSVCSHDVAESLVKYLYAILMRCHVVKYVLLSFAAVIENKFCQPAIYSCHCIRQGMPLFSIVEVRILNK